MRAIYSGHGFTLLELLVVLAIAALLLAIVPPMLGDVVDSIRVKSVARHLAAGLKTARNKAISSQTSCHAIHHLGDHPITDDFAYQTYTV